MATPTAPPTTPKTSVSTDPLYSQALAQAQAALQAEVQPIQQEQSASDASYAQQQTDATNEATALSKLLANIGPAVGNAYSQAAQNQGLLAHAASAGMQDALQGNTDGLNSLLDRIAPGQGQVKSTAPQAADVLYGLGGYVPGRSFTEAGAAQAANADMLPGEALLRGQENVKQLGVQAKAADVTFQNKIAELAGKLPGDVQTNYEKLQTLALNNKKFALDVQKAKTDAQYKQVMANLAAAKYKTSVAEFNAKQQLGYAKLTQSAQEFNARQSMTAQKMRIQANQFAQRMSAQWARIGISNRSLQYKIAQNAFKEAHGGFTQAEVKRYNQKLDAIVASAGVITRPVNGTMPTPQYQDKNGKWHDIGPNTAVPSTAKTRNEATYSNLIKAALKKGVPLQMAINRANTIFPATERNLDPSLEQLPAIAEQAAKQAAAYNQMTGVTLGTSPNGTPITWQAPRNLSAAGKKAVSGVLNLASEYLGTPYAWGGESPTGFDCSGLAQYIYAKQGISIPRTTYDQFKTGLAVPQNKLQPGDLVFFQGSDARGGLPGHVGIYIGGGKMIDAPHTGSVVRVESVNGFGGYMGARRYVH